PRLSRGGRPARRCAHAVAVEEELGVTPFVRRREADREVTEQPETELRGDCRERPSLPLGDELYEPEIRDRFGMCGTDRTRAGLSRGAVGTPKASIEPASGGTVPAPHVAARVRLRECFEQLVASEPVGVVELEASLLGCEPRERGTTSAGECVERRLQR